MLGEVLERAIRDAWLRVRKSILSDPDQLPRRLARRRMKSLTRPVRPWCIAIRASDRRITPAHWVISPEHAMDLDHPEHPYVPIEHEVSIRTHALRRYCRPVWIAAPAPDVHEVAEMLGVSYGSLRLARQKGLFYERIYRGLAGKRGDIPVIFRRDALDPASCNNKRAPHPLWGPMWGHLPEMIADDFEQPVLRRPHFGRISRSSRHPDDPAQHLGYRWVCPACKKLVRVIFYPLPVRTLFDSWFIDPVIQKKLSDADLPHTPPPTFACRRCHDIEYASTLASNFWNLLISHLTGGMLFGSEVRKPEGFRPERQRTRVRRLNCAAPMRRKVLTRVMNGWSQQQIARDLGISNHAVWLHIRELCREEDVPDRHALGAKL